MFKCRQKLRSRATCWSRRNGVTSCCVPKHCSIKSNSSPDRKLSRAVLRPVHSPFASIMAENKLIIQLFSLVRILSFSSNERTCCGCRERGRGPRISRSDFTTASTVAHAAWVCIHAKCRSQRERTRKLKPERTTLKLVYNLTEHRR